MCSRGKNVLIVLKKQQAWLKLDQMGLEPSQREKELSNKPQFRGIYLRVCQSKSQACCRGGRGSCAYSGGRGGRKGGTREPQERIEFPGKGDKGTVQAGSSFPVRQQ